MLFVQHHAKKDACVRFPEQSFVAWVEGLGNCSGNDGGGHPDVVPSGVSLVARAFAGVSRKREAAGWF